MQEVLELIHQHKCGYLHAFTSNEARREQGLLPLDPGFAEEATRILQKSANGSDVTKVIEEIGPTRALEVLQAVLHPAHRPNGLHVFIRPLLFEQKIGPSMWLLDSCDVGTTGVVVRVKMWGGVTTTVPTPVLRPGEYFAKWDGWVEVTDENGIKRRPTSTSLECTPPLVLSAGGQTSGRWLIEHTQTFHPGLPIEARQLHLRAAPDVKLRRFDVSSQEWTSLPTTLKETHFVVDLEERIRRDARRSQPDVESCDYQRE